MKFWPVTCGNKRAIFVVKQMICLKQLYQIGPMSKTRPRQRQGQAKTKPSQDQDQDQDQGGDRYKDQHVQDQ